MPGFALEPLISEAVGTLLRIGLIVLLFLLAERALRLASRQIGRRLESTVTEPEQLARLKTLLRVGRGAVVALMVIIAGMMVLYTLGINVTPLLTSAGVAGLAISLGAQMLFRDIISGILILVEGQYVIGDTVRIGGVEGRVERITLRATHLRDAEGRLHIVPNGDIRVVSNLTKARAVVDLNIPLDADFGRMLQALERAMQQAQKDPLIGSDLLDPPQILGWSGVTDTGVQVRLIANTTPGKQAEVARGLRRYALQALQAEHLQPATRLE